MSNIGRCIRCKKQTMPSFIIAGGGSFGFGMNYCDYCLITTTPGITKIAGNGDAIWAANLDTPLHAYIDLIACINIPNREQVHLERSMEARLEVNLLAKQRRNDERAKSVKQYAIQYGIGKGEHLSWGFGEVFDEYYGEINDQGQPHGMGLKIYSDKSTYIGTLYYPACQATYVFFCILNFFLCAHREVQERSAALHRASLLVATRWHAVRRSVAE